MIVFVSHGHRDQAVYSTLCMALDSARIARFDPATGLHHGEQLAGELRTVIREIQMCIFLATKSSTSSPWCLAELGAFWGAGKKILLFMADPELRANDLPPQFNGCLQTNEIEDLIRAVKSENKSAGLVGDRPANVFWLGHDLRLGETLFGQAAPEQSKLCENIRQCLHHFDHCRLMADEARTLLLHALGISITHSTFTDEECEKVRNAIEKAKTEIGRQIERSQIDFRSFSTIEEAKRLDDEACKHIQADH